MDTVHRATPPDRDRALDGFRAVPSSASSSATGWSALVLDPDGALTITSPLTTLEALAPASWILQMLGLFVLVGGCAATASLDRSTARGEPYGVWLRHRSDRLARPRFGCRLGIARARGTGRLDAGRG